MNQLSIDFAAARRDLGIARAARSAGYEWQERALGYVLEFVATHREPFLAEDAREWSEKRGLAHPPNPKAWGPVMMTAKRRGIVRAIGYAPAKSSNLAPKVQWCAV